MPILFANIPDKAYFVGDHLKPTLILASFIFGIEEN
jgi:hypothetical protein